MQHMMKQSELIQAAVDSFGVGLLTRDDFEINTSGECGIILDCRQNGSNEVVKVPYPSVVSDNLVRYEARILEVLEDVEAPPPVVIPRLQDIDYHPRPLWFSMTRLPGVSLSLLEAGRLHEDEQSALGAAVGRFAAWMAQSVSFEDFENISLDAGFAGDASSVLISRTDVVETFAGGSATFNWLEENGYPALANVLSGNYRDHCQLKNRGLLANTVIGHDDLHPGNVRFEHRGINVYPIGVLDFGIMKPSNPERELRYMWALSEASGIAAKDAYEVEMGVVLDERLLSFWAIAQRVTNAVYMVNQPSPPSGIAGLQEIGRQLQRLVPEEDFAELNRDFNGRTGYIRFSQLQPSDVTIFRNRQPRRSVPA